MEHPFPNNCIVEQSNKKIFVLTEKRKIYKAINNQQKEACSIQIDGKLLGDSIKKCDKGLLVEDNNFYLIELKGVDVQEACKQLLATVELFSNSYRKNKYNYFCRAIVTRMPAPRLLGASYQKLQKRLVANAKNKKLIYKSNMYEETI